MEKKKELFSAKNVSFFAQIIAALWIAGWAAYSFITKSQLPMKDIITSAVGIAGIFSPIYSSIFIDKLKEK